MKIALCVARSDFSAIARILTFSLNLVRIRSDFTFLSKKNAKIYFPFAGLRFFSIMWSDFGMKFENLSLSHLLCTVITLF